MTRITFNQADSWYDAMECVSVYSHEHCCYCGKPLKQKQKIAWLRLSRDESGEWYAVDPKEPVQPDEKTFERFSLPIGATCLRRHPEFRFALTEEPPPWPWEQKTDAPAS